jgi:hypothetical protein
MKYRYTNTPATCSTRSISRIWCRSCRICCCRAASATPGAIRPTATRTGRCRRCTTPFSRRCSARGAVGRGDGALLGEPADGDQEAARQQLEELIQQIIERMMEQGFITAPPDLEPERSGGALGGGHRRGGRAGTVRGHRQGTRLPRLSRAAGSARLDGPQQRRPARHPASEHGGRNDCGPQAVRVRRHAEPGPEQHDSERRAAPPRRGHSRLPAGRVLVK